MDNPIVKKITFSHDLTDRDVRDMRESLGTKLIEEGTRHIIIAFDDGADYLAFLVASRQVKMTQLSTSKNILEV